MSADWQPVAGFEQLKRRARLLAVIRQFFAQREVWEVETPLLCHATGTDPHLDFFASQFHYPPHKPLLYLQTSPEFAMKRLLAAGSGSIYQICKAFRNGEAGRFHNPEFTILEWYRVGFDLDQLMAEVAELLLTVLADSLPGLTIQSISYQQLFKKLTGLDALNFQRDLYQQFALAQGLPEAQQLCADDPALWLDFLFSHCIQPAMSPNQIYLVHGYPAIQSSLARTNPSDPRICQRFEVFINGLELGNGFHELTDAAEQTARFEREIRQRQQQGLPEVLVDTWFLQALQAGLPDCSGIAIGLDRLLMLATGSEHIQQVLAFPISNA